MIQNANSVRYQCTECDKTHPTPEEAARCHWGIGGVIEVVQIGTLNADYAPRFAYLGVDRRGVSHHGRTLIEPAEFVRKRYEKGWRKLTVTSLARGEEAGGITHDPNSGQRMWWAETVQNDRSGANNG